MRPIGAVHANPPGRGGQGGSAMRLRHVVAEDERPAPALRLGDISGARDKFRELCVGHRKFRDIKRVQEHLAHRALRHRAAKASGDSLPMRNRPPSSSTISAVEPAVARRRSAELRRDSFNCSSRARAGTQQGGGGRDISRSSVRARRAAIRRMLAPGRATARPRGARPLARAWPSGSA